MTIEWHYWRVGPRPFLPPPHPHPISFLVSGLDLTWYIAELAKNIIIVQKF